MASTSFRGLKVPSSSPELTAPLLTRCGSLPPHVALPETVNSSPLDFRTISASEFAPPRAIPFINGWVLRGYGLKRRAWQIAERLDEGS